MALRMVAIEGFGEVGRLLRLPGHRTGGDFVRKRVMLLLILFALAVDSPKHAEAGAFATEFTQLLNHAQLVLQYLRQGEQLANEIQMYADMVRNSQRFGNQPFGPIGSDISAL